MGKIVGRHLPLTEENDRFYLSPYITAEIYGEEQHLVHQLTEKEYLFHLKEETAYSFFETLRRGVSYEALIQLISSLHLQVKSGEFLSFLLESGIIE